MTSTTTTHGTDTRAATRTRTTRARRAITTAASTFAIVVATTAAVAGPAAASPAHDHYRASPTGSPYSIPIRALGGRTLATYLAEHHALDYRLR